MHPWGPVAQWLEQQTHNLLVVGSSPTGPTMLPSHRKRPFLQLFRLLSHYNASIRPLVAVLYIGWDGDQLQTLLLISFANRLCVAFI
jgi:hypothetical protein